MPGRWIPAVVVIASLGSARADSRRTVHVETTPPGATIYLGDKDGAVLGTTPADVKLAPGDQVLVIVLDGYLDEVVPVPVPAGGRGGKRPIEIDPIRMRAAESMLEIKGTAPDGARVLVDGEDRGALPRRLEVAPGPHQVQVMVGEKAIWDEWVELDSGAELVVTVAPVVDEPAPPEPGRPRGPRPPLAIVRVGPDFGWRSLSYQAPGDAMFTPSFSSRVLTAVRVEAELAPWRTLREARPLWPLALVVGGGFAPADAVVAGSRTTDQFWRTTEVGLRYRVGLGRHAAVAADAGWSRLIWAFRGDQEDALPDTDYQMVRLGLRGEGTVGPLTAWLAIANQVVVSAGALPDRFESADADGFALRLGGRAALWRGRLEAGLEYQLASFSWSFEPVMGGDYQATGASDRFDSARLWVGGVY